MCIKAQFSITSSHFIFFLGILGSLSKKFGFSKSFLSIIKSGKELWQKKICWVWSLPSTIIILKIVFTQLEQGPVPKTLLPLRIRNNNIKFRFFTEARTDQAEISYYLNLLLMEINKSYLHLLLMEVQFPSYFH